MANDLSNLSADALQQRAEATRAELARSIAAFRASATPKAIGNHLAGATSQAASGMADTVSRSAREHPLQATAGALSLGLLAAGLIWRGSSSTDRANPSPSSEATTAQEEIPVTETPATKSGRASASQEILSDVMEIGPKIALALAAGYALERFLPRAEGEDALWQDVRHQAVLGLQSARRRTLQSLSDHPRNPLPFLALAAIAVRALGRQ